MADPLTTALAGLFQGTKHMRKVNEKNCWLPPKVTKRNSADSTRRNIVAAKAREAKLAKRIDAVTARVKALEAEVKRLRRGK